MLSPVSMVESSNVWVDVPISTGGTRNYAKFINLLLSSISQTNPNVKCRVFCYGWEKELIDSFKRVHEARFVDVPVDIGIQNSVKSNSRSGEVLKLKIQSIRKSLEEATESGILWIDADSVVTRSLQPLFSVIASGENDILCTRRKHRKRSHLIFALGAIGLSNTITAKCFINNLEKRIEKSSGIDGWFQDQLEFHDAFMEVKPRLYPLGREEHTLKGVVDSMIYARRETVDLTPMEVAKYHRIECKEVENLPDSIYPL